MEEKPFVRKIQLNDLLPKRNVRRTKKLSTDGRKQIAIPTIGTSIRLIFVKDSEAKTNALEKDIIESMQRGGPKSGTRRREALALSKNDFAQIHAMDNDVYDWIGASKENAALFAFNPIEALSRVGKRVDKRLLKKLKFLESMNLPNMLPSARISSITVETSKKAGLDVSSSKKEEEVDK